METFEDSTFKEVEERVRKTEIATTTKYYNQRSRNKDLLLLSEKDFNSLTGFKIKWKDTNIQGGYDIIPFTGCPFVILGLLVKECQHGPDRKKKRRVALNRKQNGDHEYNSSKKSRKRVQETKRMGCPATIKIRAAMYFPEYTVDSYNDVRRRKLLSKLLKAAFANGASIKKQIKFYTSIPDETEHKYHLIGETAGVSQPIDQQVAGKVKSLYVEGVQNVSEMERHIHTFVQKDLNITPLSPLNRRFNPTKKDIRNHMALAADELRYASNDQINLNHLVDDWRKECPSDFFFLRTTENDAKDDFIFIHQTLWQQQMLIKYGQDICIMDATYKTSKYALPLFFLCVPTNVGHSICASFITSRETKEAIAECLRIIKEWNIDLWKPRYFMTDYDEREINAIEETFPGMRMVS